MKCKLIPLIIIGAVAFACVDEDYDFSNFNGEIEVPVNNLIAPLQFEEITLEQVLQIDDDSYIKVVNGEYALVFSGTYESEELQIESYAIDPTDYDAGNSTLDPFHSSSSTNKAASIRDYPSLPTAGTIYDDDTPVFICSLEETNTTNVHFQEKIDSAIIDVYSMTLQPTNLYLQIDFEDADDFVDELHLEDVVIQFTPGVEMTVKDGSYDPITGQISIDDIVAENNSYLLEMVVSKFDSTASYSIGEVEGLEGRYVTFSQDFEITQGHAVAYGHDLVASCLNPTTHEITAYGLSMARKLDQTKMGFNMKPSLESFTVEEIDGRIRYDIGNLGQYAFDITGVPDVLADTSTNINLYNPQIYFDINLPTSMNTVVAQFDFIIDTYGYNYHHRLAMEDPLVVDVSGQEFCVAVHQPEAYYVGSDFDGNVYDYSNSTFREFSGLGSVLSGNGFPTTMSVEVQNALIPEQDVTACKLNSNLGTVSGTYTLLCPFAIDAASQLKYANYIRDIDIELVEDLSITGLTFEADVVSTIPLNVALYLEFFDESGNHILDDNGNPVSAEMDIPNTTEGNHVYINLDYNMDDLNMIYVSGIVRGTDSNTAARPENKIQLNNVRIGFNGVYTNEL